MDCQWGKRQDDQTMVARRQRGNMIWTNRWTTAKSEFQGFIRGHSELIKAQLGQYPPFVVRIADDEHKESHSFKEIPHRLPRSGRCFNGTLSSSGAPAPFEFHGFLDRTSFCRPRCKFSKQYLLFASQLLKHVESSPGPSIK